MDIGDFKNRFHGTWIRRKLTRNRNNVCINRDIATTATSLSTRVDSTLSHLQSRSRHNDIASVTTMTTEKCEGVAEKAAGVHDALGICASKTQQTDMITGSHVNIPCP